jgi:gamma-glutamylcyclotransferase (GGCT)/AIG2-like uncharacterized protein YtfP
MEKRKLYVAYGSNLNTGQMAMRCPGARAAGSGELEGYRLTFRGPHEGAVANVEPCEGGIVPVLVWEITPADEAALDRYEGFPFLYRKEDVAVRLQDGTVKAMAYVMNEGRPTGTPGCHYYSIIREGYEEAGFDIEALREATADLAAPDEGALAERLKDQILAIRDSGVTNMFDALSVQHEANRLGYYELVILIEENPEGYARFIFTGDVSLLKD